MINLDIPVFTQHNLVTCGPFCMKMVMSYLKVERTIEEIKESCNYCSHGTLETGIVLGLKRFGIDSKLFIVPDGDTIKGAYVGMPSNKLATTLRRRGGHSKNNINKRGFAELSEVVENGQIDLSVVTRAQIEKELDKGNPWIVVVSSFAFYGSTDDKKKGLLHFVVITGYDEDNFIINDPAPDTGTRKIQKDLLLHSIYSSEGRAICVFRGDNIKQGDHNE